MPALDGMSSVIYGWWNRPDIHLPCRVCWEVFEHHWREPALSPPAPPRGRDSYGIYKLWLVSYAVSTDTDHAPLAICVDTVLLKRWQPHCWTKESPMAFAYPPTMCLQTQLYKNYEIKNYLPLLPITWLWHDFDGDQTRKLEHDTWGCSCVSKHHAGLDSFRVYIKYLQY